LRSDPLPAAAFQREEKVESTTTATANVMTESTEPKTSSKNEKLGNEFHSGARKMTSSLALVAALP
jgi:hypothetical protein